MILLDAYALIAYFRDEACADEVESLLRAKTAMSAVNVAEVVDQLVRVSGQDPDEVHSSIAILQLAGMRIIPASADLGIEAGRLRARNYRRRSCPISSADAFAAATAISMPATLATSDPHLADVVRIEGGRIHPLPDTHGDSP